MPDGQIKRETKIPYRRAVLMKAAEDQGLLGPKDRTIGGRVPDALLQEAKRNSGITETSELLTYALVQVALEDNFGAKLMARRGTVPKGVLFEG